jgi:Ser/Thr protein kinase RdoA (MazF antagonist)
MDLIEGLSGDRVKISCELCRDVGRVLAQMQQHLSSYSGSVPDGELFWERGSRLLKMLPQTSKTMNWHIDTEIVSWQWQQASDKVSQYAHDLSIGVVHTDVWPPNVICQDDRIVGVVDFDDWAVGPTFIDSIACLTEFPWYNRLDFNPDFAYAFFEGYFSYGGQLSHLERALLIEVMEMTCASWLACNALHNMQLAESMIYLQKLELLRDQQRRKNLSNAIENCIEEALLNSCRPSEHC